MLASLPPHLLPLTSNGLTLDRGQTHPHLEPPRCLLGGGQLGWCLRSLSPPPPPSPCKRPHDLQQLRPLMLALIRSLSSCQLSLSQFSKTG